MNFKHLFVYSLLLLSAGSCTSKRQTSEPDSQKKEGLATVGADSYILPAFFDNARVQAHTRMGLKYLRDNPLKFYTLADNFDQLGVKVFTRHIKSGDEGAWWPSEVGVMAPEVTDKNLVKTIIDNAHRNGQKIIAYHRHMEDDYMAEQHPDWICRTPAGKKMVKRGIRLCFNSPYSDYMLVRLLELAELGVDGFYFDEEHQPKGGCWCDYCRNGFKEETGLDMPERIDKNDSLYQKLIDYKNEIIERTFRRYREELHKRNPNLVMLIGSNTWPSMAGRHTTNRLYRIADVQKTEFSIPANAAANGKRLAFWFPPGMHPFEESVKNAHGWMLARDATCGRPPHVWMFYMLDETQALYATSALIGHGCIANIDHRESDIPEAIYKKSYELGDKVSPYLAGTKPLRWIALHYSEHARDQYIGNSYDAWKNVMYPHYGAFLALMQERLPVSMITDSQLEDNLLDGYEILYITDRQNLTLKMKCVVEAFQDRGGHIVYNDTTWHWHTADGQKDAIEMFIGEVNKTEEIPPVRVIGGGKKMQVDQFFNKTKNRLTVACMNDFSWVWIGKPRYGNIEEKDPDLYREIIGRKPPESCIGVKVILKGDSGIRPKSVIDAVSGRALEFQHNDNETQIKVPEFGHLAIVVIQY